MTKQTKETIRDIEERLETEKYLNKLKEKFDKFMEEETYNGDYPLWFKEKYVNGFRETCEAVIENSKPYFHSDEKVIAELVRTFLLDED